MLPGGAFGNVIKLIIDMGKRLKTEQMDGDHAKALRLCFSLQCLEFACVLRLCTLSSASTRQQYQAGQIIEITTNSFEVCYNRISSGGG